jgi:hypothetical protein
MVAFGNFCPKIFSTNLIFIYQQSKKSEKSKGTFVMSISIVEFTIVPLFLQISYSLVSKSEKKLFGLKSQKAVIVTVEAARKAETELSLLNKEARTPHVVQCSV